MKIGFVAPWHNDRKKTWSGSTHSLYHALSMYSEVLDFDVSLNGFEKFLIKVLDIKINKFNIIRRYDFSKLEQFLVDHKAKKYLRKNPGVPIITLHDLGFYYEKLYWYGDADIASLMENKRSMPTIVEQYSRCSHFSSHYLKERLELQMNMFRNAKRIFTMNQWLAEGIRRRTDINPNDVFYVGGGINLETARIKNTQKSGNRILFVGRDFLRKGGDLVLSAFKVLRQNYGQEFELYIAGPEELSSDLLSDGVVFLGDMDSERLSDYFNLCDIFVMPSRYEAYGLVFIEALVYGLPCIGRNAFEMPYFIQDGVNGYLIDQDDPQLLASKMYDLLKNEAMKNNVLRDRSRYMEQYSWDKVAKNILEQIEY
jgi:Glycosyltransferase